MLLLTGATGTIGKPLLRRLTAGGTPVRCLVRDPRGLGQERVRVQIALGDLADPRSFRNAMRGVETVVHLAAPLRDQRGGSIEELAGMASWQLIREAERQGVKRFVFFSATGASLTSSSRLMRAKAIVEQALVDSPLAHTVFAASWVYAPNDQFRRVMDRLQKLPLTPIPGSGNARFDPIHVEDVADCMLAALPDGPQAAESEGVRYELAGPDQLSYREIVRLALRGRKRPLLPIPIGLVRRALKLAERIQGESALATWDEVELLELTMLAANGTADAERLGVTPRRMSEAIVG